MENLKETRCDGGSTLTKLLKSFSNAFCVKGMHLKASAMRCIRTKVLITFWAISILTLAVYSTP